MIGYLQIMTAVSMWAFGSILVRSIEAPAIIILSLASLAGTIVLLAKLGAEKKFQSIVNFDKPTLFFLIAVGIGVGLNNGLFFSAIKSTTMANAMLTHYLAPLFLVIFFAPFLLREKITFVSITASLLGLAGLAMILWPGLQENGVEIGIIFGAASAIFYAFHTALEKKLAILGVNPEVAVAYKLAIPALMMFPFVVFHINNSGMLPFIELIKMAFLGIVLWAGSFVLFFKGLKTVSASHASILTYLEPVGAIFLAFLFLKEGLVLLTILGGILILFSGIMVILKGTRN